MNGCMTDPTARTDLRPMETTRTSPTEAAYDGPAMAPPEHMLLATMDAHGHRRWLSPVLSAGRWWQRRLVVAWVLIALYAITPFLEWAGLPLVQFDIPGRRLVFFGTVLRPTDTVPLALLTLSIFIFIFLLTAILGRVWCGWACPQTVYLEFVYRPLERLFIGDRGSPTRRKAAGWRFALLAAAYLVVSAHLANTFVAWFVGAKPLSHWIFQSPSNHPVAFATFALLTGSMLFLFSFFREQLCSLVCPYGRFQSALLDRRSLIVGYDAIRGEPRGRKGTTTGQCVDCGLCVRTCPAGIDIRKGFQLECVQCTQCIDACDGVMAKLQLPMGLIRYGSQDGLEHTPRRGIRMRLVVYPVLLAVLVTGFVTILARRTPIAITQLRVQDQRFVVDGDRVLTPIRLRLDNRTSESIVVSIAPAPTAQLKSVIVVTVPSFESIDAEVTAVSDIDQFTGGRRTMGLRATATGIDQEATITVLGPLTLPPIRPREAVPTEPAP